MKIAIITSRYPEKNNPYNHMFVHMRCVEMIKQGENIEVFVPSNISERYIYDSVTVNKMPSKEIVKRIQGIDVLYLHLLNIYPFNKVNGSPIYKYIIDNKTPFAMYVHGSEVQRYTSRMYEFRFKITDVLKWIKKDIFVIPIMKRFTRKTIKNRNAMFIFPSKWMKEEMERNLNCSISRYKIIPNGIDTEFFAYRNQYENRYKLLTIRSLSGKVYDIEKTVNVMSHLPEQFTLDIYGEGVYLNQYLKLIQNKNLTERIQIIPTFIGKEKMKNIFKKYSAFISTTKIDSQGITIMEAMSSGLLGINTNNSSKKEFFNDLSNSVLGNDPKEIANKINKVCNNPDLYEKITKKGSESIKKINIAITVKKEIKALSKLKKPNN